MSAPNTRFAYPECYDAFEQARESPKGIRLRFDSEEKAKTFRARMNYARRVDRKDNLTLYSPDDPLHGRSAYDPYRVTIKKDTEGFHWVYVEPMSIDTIMIEDLTELEHE
jgi:hypothetical protein